MSEFKTDDSCRGGSGSPLPPDDTPSELDRRAPETMSVRVVDRSGWAGSGPYPNIRRVTISAKCPRCGGARGATTNYNFYENGDSYSCDRWTNPCGHVDMYAAVLAEADQ